MISFEKAKEIILQHIETIPIIEKVSLNNCYGRILAKNIISSHNIPQTDNSAMDGYAVLSTDTTYALPENPVILNISGEIQAGEEKNEKILTTGCAIRIMTGAQLPKGADSVIPFEDTEELQGKVRIFKKGSIGENIRFSGEDITAGGSVLSIGEYIDSVQIGLIASINLCEISVFKKPQVGIISTGDELVEPGYPDISNKINNSNAYVLINEVRKYGGDPVYLGIAGDSFDDVKNLIEQALINDIIICSGGVSMGRYDFIPAVLKSLDADILVHKIAMKPGKPVLFGIIRGKPFFGLPGNPVSTIISFIEFVRPAILKMSGAKKYEKPVLKARLKESIKKTTGRTHFIRGRFSIKYGELIVESTGPQGSGILSSLSSANCLIILPDEIEIAEKDSFVNIQLINHGEIIVSD